ncbi:unnamed protein product [Allacma fusca]|uniref:Uncharacterized protein n=1 Tax=Allacma fusca TaxID=39272 RepID=A0A8J2LAN5_9HEXA|nr:unnamed protein product [Allacma fusca]
MGKVLTPAIEEQLKYHFRTGRALGVTPYTWETNKDLPEMSSSRVKWMAWRANHVLALGNFIFGIIRSLQTNADNSAPVWSKVYMQFVIALFFIAILTHTTNAFKKQEFIHFTCHLIKFLRYYGQEKSDIQMADDCWKSLILSGPRRFSST